MNPTELEQIRRKLRGVNYTGGNIQSILALLQGGGLFGGENTLGGFAGFGGGGTGGGGTGGGGGGGGSVGGTGMSDTLDGNPGLERIGLGGGNTPLTAILAALGITPE